MWSIGLGIPVDIVTKPFMDFIAEVLPRSSDRLLRSCEQRDAFGTPGYRWYKGHQRPIYT